MDTNMAELKADRQELFEKSCEQIIKQGRPGGRLKTNVYGRTTFSCAYYSTADGKSVYCAVGALDHEMAKKAQNMKIGAVDDWMASYSDDTYDNHLSVRDITPAWFVEHEGFLASLQEAHDGAGVEHYGDPERFVEAFKANVRKLCEDYDLAVPACVTRG